MSIIPLSKANALSIFLEMASYMRSHPDEIKRLYCKAAVLECGGNVSAAARRLNMHRRSLVRILDRGQVK